MHTVRWQGASLWTTLQAPTASPGLPVLPQADGAMVASGPPGLAVTSQAAQRSTEADDDPAFVSHSSDMKKLLTMALPDTSVSVNVHRAGSSLFLDGGVAASRPHSPQRRRASDDALAPVARTRSEERACRASDDAAASQHAPRRESNSHGPDCQHGAPSALNASQRDAGGRSSSARSERVESRSSGLRSGRAQTDGARVGKCQARGTSRGVHSAGEHGKIGGPVFTWQLDEVQTLVSSDMVVLQGGGGAGSAGQPHMRVHHLQQGEVISAQASLDLWLDSMLNDAEAAALCYHADGDVQVCALLHHSAVALAIFCMTTARKCATCIHTFSASAHTVSVQGYHVVRTEDIPALGGAHEAAHACLSTAAAIMRLLRETCRTDGASYVLSKDADTQTVRLFELSHATAASPEEQADAMATDASLADPGTATAPLATNAATTTSPPCSATCSAPAAAHHPAVARDESRRLSSPYAHRVAHLCYQMAKQVLRQRSAASEQNVSRGGQARRLLERCVSLVDAAARPGLFAAAQLLLAETYLDSCLVDLSAERRSLQLSACDSPCSKLGGSAAVVAATLGSAVHTDVESDCIAAAHQLSLGVNTLHGVQLAKHVSLRSALRKRLCTAYTALSEALLARCMPGAALRSALFAACHLNPGSIRSEDADSTGELRTLRLIAITHVAMVCLLPFVECLRGARLFCASLVVAHTSREQHTAPQTRAPVRSATGPGSSVQAERLKGCDAAAAASVAEAETASLQGKGSVVAHCAEQTVLRPPDSLPAPTRLLADAEANLSLAVSHLLGALKRCGALQVCLLAPSLQPAIRVTPVFRLGCHLSCVQNVPNAYEKVHYCALQSSRERDAFFNELTVELTVAYLRLGSSLLRGGRFTRALQHFKQGVHLFDGAQAKGGVAACYCCLGALFIRKAGPGTERTTGMGELVERQAGCDESLRHFDLALQVCLPWIWTQ